MSMAAAEAVRTKADQVLSFFAIRTRNFIHDAKAECLGDSREGANRVVFNKTRRTLK
jgi:hypothetical protein